MSDDILIQGSDRPSRWLVTVDHATNRVPDTIGDLGLPPADMARHIAYDPGAWGVAETLAARLDGPAVGANFSRLVIDPNRGLDDPTLVMQLYDGSIIPANRGLAASQIASRIAAHYQPYHDTVARLAAARKDPVLVAVHSFTPQLRGRPPRPWHIGVLTAKDRRLGDALLARLRAEGDLVVGDNQPYTGALHGDSMDRHGVRMGRPHVLIELRNDLIETPEQQAAWGARLAPLLDAALADAQV